MEKGESCVSASNSSPPRDYSWKLVAAFVAVLSVVALVTAIAALALQLTANRRPEAALNKQLLSITRNLTESELKEVAATVSRHHQNQKTRRSITTDNHGCVSNLDKTRRTKPTAHITGMHFKTKNITNRNLILSANWSCNDNIPAFRSHVSGGMSFNKTTGFLRVPVSGYYNVYSQVLVEPQSTSPGFVFGHFTSYCACPSYEPNCQCSVLEPGVGYVFNNELQFNTLAASTTFNSRPQSSYHGGVFYLEEGSYLGVLVKLAHNNAPRVGFSAIFDNSFFGAFLISEKASPQPSLSANIPTKPTPSPSCVCS